MLADLGHTETAPFARAHGSSAGEEALAGALCYALGAGGEATLRDAMRFSAGRDALAREYARGFEVTRELARPALLAALSRADSVRGALVQAYLEVLSEVPDLDVAGRAGRGEAEDVSRMATGSSRPAESTPGAGSKASPTSTGSCAPNPASRRPPPNRP